jgi:type II secretory pathway component PulK
MKFPSSKRVLLIFTTTVSSQALLASYKVSHRTAQKKLHVIAETVILLAAIDKVQKMFGRKCAQQLRNIPLSINMVSEQTADVSVDLELQLIEKLRNKRFSVQIEEVTDCSNTIT